MAKRKANGSTMGTLDAAGIGASRNEVASWTKDQEESALVAADARMMGAPIEVPAYANGLMLEIGQSYFIAGVRYYTGRLVAQTGDALILEDAAWIPDTGRFNEAMASGSFSEVEPYPDGARVRVLLSAIFDVCDWPHELPRAAK